MSGQRAIGRSPRMRLPNRRAVRGVSLIELMIALVLGLIVVAAVFNVYTGTSRSARFSDGLQSLQEGGRHGVGVLQRSFRLAGYSTTTALTPFDIAAGDDATLVVATTALSDCGGGSTAAFGGVARNVYRFDAASQAITCENRETGVALPLVENVDAFRVLYGLDENDDGSPERFVPWDAGLDADRVAALRFALLVNSGGPIRSRTASTTHPVLDSEVVSPADRQVRHVFQGTVQLRNRR